MSKFRRGGFVFITWKGDHPPRHVHIFKDGKFILKWNFEANVPMRGKITARLRKLIDDLQKSNKI